MSFSKIPSTKALLITPSDENFLPPINAGASGVAVYVGIGGQITVVNSSNVTQVIEATSGELLDVLVKKVLNTGTSATSLLGIYRIVGGGSFGNTQWQSLTVQNWNNITDTWS
jgi:hypothetical protein